MVGNFLCSFERQVHYTDTSENTIELSRGVGGRESQGLSGPREERTWCWLERSGAILWPT